MSSAPVIEWLMKGDPAIRWQVMCDLLDVPESQWSAERLKVETEGWGMRLLALQDEDGQWDGGSFLPQGFTWERMRREGQPWTSTCWALTQLQDFGLDPTSEGAQRSVQLVGQNSRWDHAGQEYWSGEVEECINGRTLGQGAYFGVEVEAIASLLVGQKLGDGGWNCERERGSQRSSFDSTINVLEGLLEFERASGGTQASKRARLSGEEYLLSRHLMYRRTTGALIKDEYLELSYPPRWHYNILRALEYFRMANAHDGTEPDVRTSEAVERSGHCNVVMAGGAWEVATEAVAGSRWILDRGSLRDG
ncbi:hypothetical protein [Nesterenkonia haasae]|uniref:hypothetical protein n=1 Tax=Nesterenkonia haasae TaxID=2587813 RepID=UPI002E28B52A|nr:hypothetical protein [Nesterenkonia haasae]